MHAVASAARGRGRVSLGVLNTTAAVLPKMIANKGGHIFIMSSIAGRKVFKGLSVHVDMAELFVMPTPQGW